VKKELWKDIFKLFSKLKQLVKFCVALNFSNFYSYLLLLLFCSFNIRGYNQMIQLLQNVMLYLQPDSIWACPRSRPRWSGCSGTRCARRALKGCTAASCPTSAKSRPPSPSPTTSMKERESTLESKWSKNWKSSLIEAHQKKLRLSFKIFLCYKTIYLQEMIMMRAEN